MTVDWGSQINYLKATRDLYYNDDYLAFLVKNVWKLNKPVKVVDFGCGYGYLGLKLLPLLPEGSSYTGFDQDQQLIKQARYYFKSLSYSATFERVDLEEAQIEQVYDLALSHAFLLHMPNPRSMLEKMACSLVNGGRLICFEPHWIAGMANQYGDGISQSSIVPLGIVQKLYEDQTNLTGKSGNIGMAVSMLMREVGLTQIEARVSDKVNLLFNDQHEVNLRQSLISEGIGAEPLDRTRYVENLLKKGVSAEEAEQLYESEKRLAVCFAQNISFAYAPNMKITTGIVS